MSPGGITVGVTGDKSSISMGVVSIGVSLGCMLTVFFLVSSFLTWFCPL